MTLRNRKQSNDTLSDVFTGSSAEELDRMDDDDTHLLNEKQRSVPLETYSLSQITCHVIMFLNKSNGRISA